MAFVETVKGLIQLSRPVEWTKSFANMFFAIAMAFYVHGVKPDFFLFSVGLASIAFLWSGLYTLNDYSDWKHDLQHPVKKHRAIPSKKVNPQLAFFYGLTLVFLAFLTGFFIKNIFFLGALLGMTLNQFLYSHKPFKLKTKTVLDLISGSLVNPLLRFYAGWFLVVKSFLVPALILPFILGLQFAGYTFYRLFSKKHEQKIKYNSSIVVFGEKKVKLAAFIAMFFGITAFILMLLNPFIDFIPLEWGFLPAKYGLLLVTTLFFSLFYFKAFFNPEKVDLKKLYKLFYFNYAIVLIEFFLIFVFLR